VSVNGGPYARLINDTIDLAQEKWTPLKHHFWILPSPKMQHSPPEKN